MGEQREISLKIFNMKPKPPSKQEVRARVKELRDHLDLDVLRDDEKVELVKTRIRTRLTQDEINILLFYVATGSYLGTAKMLGCSSSTAKSLIVPILNKLREP